MKIHLFLILIGSSLLILGCDAAYRIKRDNDRLDGQVSTDCIKSAIEKVEGIKIVSDEEYTNRFICGKGKHARRMTYLTRVGTVGLEACYEGSTLKSFSHGQAKLPTTSNLETAPVVLATMREVESSIELRCSIKGFVSGMKSNCALVKCDQ